MEGSSSSGSSLGDPKTSDLAGIVSGHNTNIFSTNVLDVIQLVVNIYLICEYSNENKSHAIRRAATNIFNKNVVTMLQS